MKRTSNVLPRAAALIMALLLCGLATIGSAQAATRAVRAENMSVARGETNKLFVSFDTLGDEYAISFTLCFDTNQLAFVSAARGSSVSNMVPTPGYTPNFNGASTGRVSVLINLNIQTAQTWPAGTQSLMEFQFRALQGAGSTNTTVSFCSPAPEVSSPFGDVLPSSSISANVSIIGACSYQLDTNSASFSDATASGSVNVIADANCNWGVTNTNSWITITGGEGGSGNGTVNYDVAANTSASPRSGVVLIGGQTFTVTQAGFVCSYLLFETGATHDYGAETNSIDLVTDDPCEWTIENTNSWIAIHSPTTNIGSGEFTYAVAANPSSLLRTGIVTVANQPVTIVQFGAPCVFAVSPLSTNFSSGAAATGDLSVSAPAGCEWQAFTVDDWISVASDLRTGSATVTYSIAANTSLDPRTGYIYIADQTVEITQQGGACTFTLSVSNRTHTSEATTNSVDVTTGDGCMWNVSTTNEWISILSATNNNASGTVTYALSENASLTNRVGFVFIADQTLVVTQEAVVCSYSVNVSSRRHSTGAQDAPVNVTSPSPCPWFVENTNTWISIKQGASGTGNGTVIYHVEANSSAFSRTGVVTVAGWPVTIIQDGFGCYYTITPASTNYSASAASGSVEISVFPGCPVDVANPNSWISITATNTNSISYIVQANTTTNERTGVIMIADQAFTVTQQASDCFYVLATNSVSFSAAAQNGSVALNSHPNCPWAVSTATSWISLLSSTNNTNSGVVSFSVQTNATIFPRTGTITIAGQTFTVVQEGIACSLALQWSNWVHRAISETGTVGVISISGCSWAVTNTNNWISVNAMSGDGSTNLGYSVAANTNSDPRSGALNIGGIPYFITQMGTACSYRLSPTNSPRGNGANSGTINLTASGGCSWSIINTNPWITITTGASGAGSASIGYSFTKNTNATMRSGCLNIAGEIFLLNQWSTNCDIALQPIGRNHSNAAEAGTIKLDSAFTTCAWSVNNTNSWITIAPASLSGTGGATLNYNVLTNASGLPRTGVFTVNGIGFTVVQAGAPCSYVFSANSTNVNADGSSVSINITTGDGCTWNVGTTNSWISIDSPLNNTNSGTLSFTVAANNAAFQRVGAITIGEQMVVVTQAAAQCSFTLATNVALHGYAPTTGFISVNTLLACAWSVNNTNAWIAFASTNNTNSGSLAYMVLTNASIYARTGVVMVAGQPFSIVQAGAPCTYVLGTNFISHASGAETAAVAVVTADGCVWPASTATPWINILSGPSGTNTGLLAYSVNSNTTVFARTGTIDVAGQTLTVVQAGTPCSYSLSQSNVTLGSAASTGSVSVATLAGCAWTASTADSWITITSATNGVVTYAVLTNGGSLRSGTITVANVPFQITQAGSIRALRAIDTQVARGQTNRVLVSFESTGIENALGFTVCFDTNLLSFVNAVGGSAATNLGANLNLNTSASSQGQVGVSFALNGGQTMPAGSNAIVEVFFRAAAGTTFTNTAVTLCDSFLDREVSDVNGSSLPAAYSDANVTILGTCMFALTPGATNFPANGGSDSIGVLTHPSCSWSASSGMSWIHIIGATNATGSAAVMFGVDANSTASPRSGTLTVAGQTVVITQDGQPCSYVLSTNVMTHGFGAETGSVHLATITGCAWIVNNTNEWITINNTNGIGDGDVFYSIASNSLSLARTGIVEIAQSTFAIVQSGAPCSYSLAGITNKLHGYMSETGAVSVVAPVGCNWLIDNTNSWAAFPSGLSGSGSNTISYFVGYNPNGVARTGTVFIATRPYTIRQPANPCPVALTPASGDHGPSWATNTISVTVSGGCAWTASNTNSWIFLSTNSGVGNGTLKYIIAPNPVGVPRVASFSISGRDFVITQAAATCLFSLNPPGWFHGPNGESGTIDVRTIDLGSSGCSWSLQNTNGWVTFTSPLSGNGPMTLSYTVAANPSSLSRSGNIVIGNRVFGISQAGVGCTFNLSSTSTNFSFGAQTGSVFVSTPTGCDWQASTTNSWITFSTTNFTNSAAFAFSVASNTTAASRVGAIILGGQMFSVTQAGVPCSFTLNTTNLSVSYVASTNFVSVTAPTGCDWPAGSSAVNWITVAPSTNTSGNGIATLLIDLNPSASARTGTASIAGQTVSVTQLGAPCLFTLAVTNMTHTAKEEDATIPFSGPIGCPWSVSTTNLWIDIFSAISGTTTGNLVYVVSTNANSFSRTGYVQVANQTLKIVQAGAACAFNLSATSASYDSSPATNTVTVLTPTGCAWGSRTSDSWIQILAGSTNDGNGIVRYSIATNYLSTSRTGTIVIANQSFPVIQAGAICSYSLTPSSDTLSAGNVTGLVRIATTGNCMWVVVKTNDWIAIKSGGEGTNSGLLRYTVATNTSPSARVAYITIADQVFTLTQLGSPCSYSLSSTGRIHSSLLDTGQVAVVTVSECNWEVANTNSWIQFQTATNGLGTMVLTYTVQPNPNSVDRTGTFTVGSQSSTVTYTVTQLGAECSYALDSYSALHGGLSETGTFQVVTPAGCTWSVSKTNSWITLLSNSSQTNSGPVSYSVAVNTTGASRVGTIKIGNNIYFMVTQATVACSYSVTPTNLNHGFEAETNFISVTTSNICPWVVTKTNSWINLISSSNQTGNATIGYFVTANPSSSGRTGVVLVAGQPVTIRQAGLVCSYSVVPTFHNHGFGAETNQVTVTCPSLCTWAVVNTNSWINIQTATNNTGPGTMKYAVSRNPSASARTGYINVDGQVFTVWQNGAPFILASNKTVQCNTVWDFDPPVPSGSCGASGATMFVTSTTTNFGCGSTYIAKRVWDATDMCGVEILATQTVTVVSPPPIMTCAQDKTAECGSVWTFNAPTAIDACSGASLNASIRTVSTVTNSVGMCGNTYAVTRTWEVADGCTNKSTCSQTVRIIDTTPPVVSCASNKTVECGTAWHFDAPTGNDSCGGTNVTIRILSTSTNATANCGFVATRIWEVLDLCSNSATCTQIVTAVDTTPPAVVCSQAKTVECGSAWTFDQPAATDSCSGATISILGTVTNGVCGGAFIATRTWQAVDGCGNADFCSQTVTVRDTTPPIASTVTNKTVELGAAWDFDAPTAVDACSGTNVFISFVTSTNKTGFCGSTFTATRIWDIADSCSNKVTRLQIVTVRDTTPPVFSGVSNKAVNCQAAWNFDTPTAIDLPSGTIVPVVAISTVTNGTCGSNFSAVRVWRATDACSNSSTFSQTVVGRALVNVAGTIYVPTNYPATLTDKRVASATVIAPTNGASAADGSYVCTFEADTNVLLVPMPPGSGTASDGVSTIDLSLVRRHILNITSLDTPYKLLAADVDGSGVISTVDLTAMRRVILGVTNRFARGVWRFVPSDFSFTNAQSPWNAPTNRIYPDIDQDLSEQDFVAIKLGDVNNSWTTGLGGGAGAGAGFTGGGGGGPAFKAPQVAKSIVTFTVSNASSLPGTSVVVRVTATGFSRVTSVQGTIAWDPRVIQFAATEQFGVSGFSASSFGTALVTNGTISFSWDDPAASGVSVADGSVVFALRFNVVGSSGATSHVAVNDSITIREVGVDFTPAIFQTVDGQLDVASTNATQVSYQTMANGAPGVSVPTIPGKTYILEYTDFVPSTNWSALPGVSGDGTTKLLNDPSPASAQRFYRVRIQ